MFWWMLQGMLQSSALGQYYLDLQNPKFKTAFAIYHRRYSTNTNPKWPLAQPMRLLGHNGEQSRDFDHRVPRTHFISAGDPRV
jgi:glutamate synthase domain-containing protein 1